jgi:hypothetical protein
LKLVGDRLLPRGGKGMKPNPRALYKRVASKPRSRGWL